MKTLKNVSIYIVVIIIILALVSIFESLVPKNKLTYTEFISEIKDENVDKVVLKDGTAFVTLKNEKDGKKDFEVTVLSTDNFERFMIEKIDEGNTVDYTPSVWHAPFWVSFIPYILLIAVFFFIFMFVFNQNQAGANKVLSFGRSRAKLYTTSKITFKDVAGAEEEKEELAELVTFLKDPQRYVSIGARIPKGVLMVGPPGTGKTYLAKAVAGEAGVPFFSISGSDFVEMYVGVGASRVRDLFEQAKKNCPCIIFIDEIDAVGRHRGAGLGGGHDEREQTLNQLLVEMDGFSPNEGVIIIAATNRPDILDPALLRPGRFDRKVTVGYPDIKAREEILKVHARNKPFAQDVDMAEIAKNTSGFTAADLENLLNEAALLTARRKKDYIGQDEIKEATFKVIVGPEKRSRVMTEKDKRLTAYHEAGHAITVRLESSTEKVDRISIIPAGLAGGYTSSRPDEDTSYQTRSQLLEQIVIALGGRAAEELVLGEVSTGASGDLKRANSIARNMVSRYGMSSEVGNMIFGDDSDEVFIGRDMAHTKNYSEEMSAIIDNEVKKIIDSSYLKAKSLLNDHMDILHRVVKVLLEKEKIEGDEFERLFKAEN
ncbi:MAG: ATP-dependent zinc metalloprotease FtsH [Clostridiales bacterium]|jgi:cell division protease FtsH|nr:ATP-dependent zinc metalloprotease FtsH [Clostridiales bacterium]